MRVLHKAGLFFLEVLALTADDDQWVILIFQGFDDLLCKAEELFCCQDFAALVVGVNSAQCQLNN